MKSSTIVIAVLAGALAAALDAAAQSSVYRWIDRDGKVQYSDTPPPRDASSVTQKRVGDAAPEQSLPYATQLAVRKSPVTLYVSTDCGDPCARGRELLSQRGVPFSERDAQRSPADAEALRKLVGALEVPVIVVGESKVKGWEEGQWHSALDGAGYPRSRLPGQAPTRPMVSSEPPRAPWPAASEPAAAPASEPAAAPAPEPAPAK